MTYPAITLYIDGEWAEGKGGRGDDILNPATGEVLGRVPFAEPEDVDRAIEAARAAFPAWRDAGPERRGEILRRAAGFLHARAAEIGRVMTLEEGKPLPEATGEVHRAAAQLEWYAEEARRAYGRIIPTDPGQVLSVRTAPVGPVGAFDLHFTPVEEMDRMAPYHFAVEVEDWDGFLAHLRELGIRHTRPIMRPENNSMFCYIHDPDHTMIELVYHHRRPFPPPMAYDPAEKAVTKVLAEAEAAR